MIPECQKGQKVLILLDFEISKVTFVQIYIIQLFRQGLSRQLLT